MKLLGQGAPLRGPAHSGTQLPLPRSGCHLLGRMFSLEGRLPCLQAWELMTWFPQA